MKAILTFFVLFFSVNLFSQNAYLAYESFDGVSGTALHNASGGQGWSSTWDVQNGVVAGYLFDNNSLTYNNLKTNGNKLSGGYQYVTSGRNLDYQDGGDFDDYVTGGDAIGSTVGSELWFSILLQKNLNNDDPVYADLHNSNLNWCNTCASNKIGVGYFGTISNVNNEKKWSIRIGNTVYNSSIPLVTNASTLLVLKITFNSDKTNVDLYVNPTSIGNNGTPTLPNLSQSTTDLIRLRSLSLYLGNDINNGFADEIRFAKSYAVVTANENVSINLPPVAKFSSNPSSGQAPLSVSVDATASFDPEGGSLTYNWNWGDGTPNTTNPVSNHLYNSDITGLINIELTVRDNFNLKNFTTKTIPIYFPGTNYFSCQSTGTALNEASCSQSNGRIRINLGLATNPTYTFKNSQGTSYPLINNNEFQNLSAGKYFVTVTGSNGCRDEYSLLMTTDSSTCNGWKPDLCKMSVGVNINGLADWSWENQFINLFKHVREDIITFHNNCGCWDSNVGNQIKLDENGYPIGLPQITSASNETNIRWMISSGAGNLKPNEQYVLLYDGIGTLSINGANAVSITKGRLLFNVPSNSDNIWLDITYSQPDDYLRNFRLLKASEEFIDLSINTFNKTFLSRLSPFSTIRFMDWGATNGNKLSKWEDRKLPSFRTYSGPRGVPYELMIQLANQTQKDVWICVPHMADSNYIISLANLFKNNLNSNLKLYLEYSNEVWNWQFEQAHYNNANRPLNLNYGRASAEKSKKLFRIWESVYGKDMNRVVRVLGLQAGFNYLNEEIMSQIPDKDWDMASLTYYFGLDHSDKGNPVLNASSTGEDVNRNARNNFYGTGNWWKNVKQDYRTIKMLGKAISSYEGGPHYTDFQTHPYQQAMYDAQYLQSMYRMYDDVLDSIRAMGNQLAMAFTLSGLQESVYGSWGHLPNMYQNPPYTTTAPKYQAILDNSCLPFKDLYFGQPVEFYAPTLIAKPGDTVCLDVKVKDFINITSGQFTMTFDTSVLKFISVKSGNILGVSAGTFGTVPSLLNRGKITMAYDAPAGSLPDGITTYDGAIFCRICFKVNSYVAQGKFSPFAFDGSLTNIYFENKGGKVDFKNTDGKVLIDSKLSVNENLIFEVLLKDKNNAALSWLNIFAKNAFGFVIEKSKDGVNFEAISFVEANKTNNNIYNFIDSNLRNGQYYYKIKMILQDQTYTYTEVKSINVYQDNEIVIIPNPVLNEFSVQIENKLQPFEICNQLGQVVKSGEFIPSVINVSDLISGFYYLKINGSTTKFIKVD